jgi:hypothetical protein
MSQGGNVGPAALDNLDPDPASPFPLKGQPWELEGRVHIGPGLPPEQCGTSHLQFVSRTNSCLLARLVSAVADTRMPL